MNKNNPLVSIVTVNYNGEKYLDACFSSLSSLNYPKDKLEVIMVDNGSTDGSLEFVAKKFSGVKIIKNEINNYCKANNLGIKHAKGRFIALINNDLKLDKEWLVELVSLIKEKDDIGAVTGKVFFFDGKLQATGHYELPHFYWSDRGFKEDDKGQYSQVEELKSISHCAVLYKKECLDSVGLLDEDFNMYMEDVDMSIRAKQKGWSLFYAPRAIAYHKFHGSAQDSLADFYCEKNRLLLVAKHYPFELSDALFGKGYFTALNKKSELIKVLPDVFTKFIKHHDTKTVVSILPPIFASLEKILNLEKDYLIKQLDCNKDQVESLRNEISQKNQVLQQKDTEVSYIEERNAQICELVSRQGQLLRQKDTEIEHINSEIQRLNADILHLKEVENSLKRIINQDTDFISQQKQIIQQKDIEIAGLKEKINQIYGSETYRYIAIPLWKVLDKIRRLKPQPKNSKQMQLLIIKPYYVSSEEAEKAIAYFRKSYSTARIALVANLFKHDYDRFYDNKDINERFFYSPDINKLGIFTTLGLINKLEKRKFDEVIVLIGRPAYHGYRKAKLLASFSGAKKARMYFVGTGAFEPLRSLASFELLWALLYGSVLLYGVLILFSIFIVTPMKIRKLFKR